jgi:hypothetical protein
MEGKVEVEVKRKYLVRKGYAVVTDTRRYEGGTLALLTDKEYQSQSWKLEEGVVDGDSPSEGDVSNKDMTEGDISNRAMSSKGSPLVRRSSGRTAGRSSKGK